MVIDKKAFQSKINGNSIFNIIKAEITKIDAYNKTNIVQDNQSEFIDAIDTAINNLGNEISIRNNSDTVSFDFKIARKNYRSDKSNNYKASIRVNPDNNICCYIPSTYRYMVEFNSKLYDTIYEYDTRKQFDLDLQKSLSGFLIDDLDYSRIEQGYITVRLNAKAYAKVIAFYFSRLAIAYLAKSNIKAKAVPNANGVKIVMSLN